MSVFPLLPQAFGGRSSPLMSGDATVLVPMNQALAFLTIIGNLDGAVCRTGLEVAAVGSGSALHAIAVHPENPANA